MLHPSRREAGAYPTAQRFFKPIFFRAVSTMCICWSFNQQSAVPKVIKAYWCTYIDDLSISFLHAYRQYPLPYALDLPKLISTTQPTRTYKLCRGIILVEINPWSTLRREMHNDQRSNTVHVHSLCRSITSIPSISKYSSHFSLFLY
jgi:hypothetical protein